MRELGVAAIVITFNRRDGVRRALRALEAQRRRADDVLVVVNASSDGTLEMLADEFSAVSVLNLTENLGPAAAVSAGLEWARAQGFDHAFLLEDDSVPAPDAIATLLDAIETDSNLGMVGADGARLVFGFPRAVAQPPRQQIIDCDFVLSDVALVRREVIERVGPQRADFFFMYTDIEYCVRVKRAGFRIALVPAARAEFEHAGAQGSQTAWRAYYQTRNHLRAALDGSRPLADTCGWMARTAWLGANDLRRGGERATRLRMRWRGATDAVRGRMGRTLEPRQGIARRRTQATKEPTDDVAVLLVIDRIEDIGGAEGSTALVLSGLHGRGVTFGVVALHGVEVRERPALEAAGVQFFTPARRGLISQVRCVVTAIRQTHPDLVHATLARSELVARLAGLVARVPVMTSIVNMQYDRAAQAVARSRWKLEAYRRLDSFLARHATFAFHAISESTAAAGREHLGIDPDRITVVTRGRDRALLGEPTDQRRGAAREALGIAHDRFVLFNVGRQDHQKGQRYLLDSLAGLVDRHDLVLLIAGREGSATEGLCEQIDCLDLAGHVRLLGVRADVPDLLCAADLFVFPSIYEGLGGALLEAMALGVPIVAFDVPAVREAVGDAGVLVPTQRSAALRDAIDELLESPARRDALSAAGRDRFDALYTNQRYLANMLELYQTVVRAARDSSRSQGPATPARNASR